MTWNELQSRQPDEAAAFYAGLFGWGMEPINEGGRTGYVTIKHSAGWMNGGIMPTTETRADAPSFWLIYFTVPSCDAAAARPEERRGRVRAGPLGPGGGSV